MAIIIALIVLPVGCNMVRFHYPLKFAVLRTIYFYSETKWSNDFSEWNFSKIKIGMNKREVLKTLGQPLWESCEHDKCTWSYATGKGFNVDFDRRYIYFDEQSKVKTIQRDYYVD
jgi:outer membrane protein assembly factor BamE (lipoprotein component of BamABCDE complex)